MYQSKTGNFLGQTKSSQFAHIQNLSITFHPGEKKPYLAQKKSKGFEIQETFPNELDRIRANPKSFSGLKSLKIPQRNNKKMINFLDRAELSPIISRALSNELIKNPNLKCSISPKATRHLSPMADVLSESQLSNPTPVSSKLDKTVLRHLNLKKELDYTIQDLKEPTKLRSSSCLEDIILLSESKNLTNFEFIEENLKMCTEIIKNIIIRMNEIGRKNEVSLIDKLWRHMVMTVDETIEGFKQTERKFRLMAKTSL